MTFDRFYKQLDTISALRENRLHMANMVLTDHELTPYLLELVFMIDDPVSSKASWVLEFVVKQKPDWLIPHMDRFAQNIRFVKLDSSVRPIAKICEILMEAYFSKKPSSIKSVITKDQLEKITEACFDWMIRDEKVAVKAYSMRCLFLLGTKYDWVHPELKLILEKDYESHTAAYKARARDILKRLEVGGSGE